MQVLHLYYPRLNLQCFEESKELAKVRKKRARKRRGGVREKASCKMYATSLYWRENNNDVNLATFNQNENNRVFIGKILSLENN